MEDNNNFTITQPPQQQEQPLVNYGTGEESGSLDYSERFRPMKQDDDSSNNSSSGNNHHNHKLHNKLLFKRMITRQQQPKRKGHQNRGNGNLGNNNNNNNPYDSVPKSSSGFGNFVRLKYFVIPYLLVISLLLFLCFDKYNTNIQHTTFVVQYNIQMEYIVSSLSYFFTMSMLQSIDTYVMDVQSYSTSSSNTEQDVIDNLSKWPFITTPNFAWKAQKLIHETSAYHIGQQHFVFSKDEITVWNNYTKQHAKDWV